MPLVHPLDIPELAAAICLHLARRDLPVCLLVCRQWHAALLPLVWNTVDKTPTAEALQRHAHLVTTMRCMNEFSPALSRITLPNLAALDITRRRRRYENRHQPWPMLSFTLFLQHNPTITRLVIFDDDFSPHASQFWRAVADLPHPLRLLRVCSALICIESFADFLTACSHAETLDLPYFTSPSLALSIEDTARIGSLRFQWLKTLHLQGILVDEVEHLCTMLSHCLGLERLSFGYHPSERPVKLHIDRLVSLARTRPWPLLKHLWISIPQWTLEQSQDFLEAVTFLPLKSLEMCSSISPKAFDTLVHTQFPTITHLSLAGGLPAATSAMNQRVLKLCPLLITFKGSTLSSADIIDEPSAGPWACLRLEKLDLAFEITIDDNSTAMASQVPPEELNAADLAMGTTKVEDERLRLRRLKQQEVRRQHRCVLEQLARLTSLQDLKVSSRDVRVKIGLSFRLDHGLAMLEPLSRLRSVEMDKTSQPLRKQDLEWMVQHWNRLQCLRGFSISANPDAEKTQCYDILRQQHLD